MVLGLMVGAKVDDYMERTRPENFRVVEVDGGEGKAVRVGDDADLRTTAAGLAALFAGYHDPRDLATLGVVHGLDQAGVEFLQAMHAGPKPWSPDYY